MRLRDDTLRTGHLVVPHSSSSSSGSLMFLVAGAADIEPLQHVLRFVEALDSVSGIDVADQTRLDSVDPSINLSRIVRIEAKELAGLGRAEIEAILGPAIERLRAGELEIFPAAGGAVGGVAEGIQFLNREDDVAKLETLIRHNPVLVVRAPRRSGKTSILRKLEATLAADFEIQYLDLQRDRDLNTAAARLRSIVTSCAFRPAIEVVAAMGWKNALIALVNELRGRTNRPPLLLLDELVFLFEAGLGGGEADIVTQIRESLEGLQQVLDATDVRLVFAGSLDLLEFVSRYLDRAEIADLLLHAASFVLPPLAESSLTIQIRRLLLGSGLVIEDDDLEWFSSSVDIAVPYPGLTFLDRLSHELRRAGRMGPGELDRLLARFLRETDSFREFESHLANAPLVRRRSIESAIRRLVERPFEAGVPVSEIQQEVPAERDFVWMIETFPIQANGQRARCVSRLWWRWWRIQLGIEP